MEAQLPPFSFSFCRGRRDGNGVLVRSNHRILSFFIPPPSPALPFFIFYLFPFLCARSALLSPHCCVLREFGRVSFSPRAVRIVVLLRFSRFSQRAFRFCCLVSSRAFRVAACRFPRVRFALIFCVRSVAFRFHRVRFALLRFCVFLSCRRARSPFRSCVVFPFFVVRFPRARSALLCFSFRACVSHCCVFV